MVSENGEDAQFSFQSLESWDPGFCLICNVVDHISSKHHSICAELGDHIYPVLHFFLVVERAAVDIGDLRDGKSVKGIRQIFVFQGVADDSVAVTPLPNAV